MFIARLRPALAGLMLVVFASVASAQDKPTLTATVNGSTVSLNWTVVPGAPTYELLAQSGGSQLGPFPVGSGTSVDIPGVPPGSYILQVRAAAGALKGPYSDPVTVVVGNPTPPAAPTGLAAVINDLSASVSWNLNNPAGSLSSVRLRVSQTPGGTPIADVPLAASATSFYIPTAAAGTYYFTVVAIGAGGATPSSEFTLSLPGCAAPPAIPLTAISLGAFIQFSWPLLPGSTGYTLEVGNTPGGGPNIGTVSRGPTQTSFSFYGAPDGNYYTTLRSALTCGQAVSSAETLLTVAQPPRGPALTKAQAHSVLTEGARAMAAQYPSELRNSCGNTNWVFKLLRHLRGIDTRYGMNYKRGQIGDLSQDVILYNFAEVPNEQATARDVYGWDVISQHCGGNPSWFNADITNASGQARWTILEYLMAGYRP